MSPASHGSRLGVLLVAGALALSIGIYFSPTPSGQEPEVVAPVERNAGSAMPPAPRGSQAPARASLRMSPKVAYDPFAPIRPLQVATLGAPKAVKETKTAAPVGPPAPPPPSAPPLPFVAVGSLAGKDVAGGTTVAFLQQNDRLLVVSAGQVLANTYRVEAIGPQKIEFTYLPLMQRQALTLGPTP